MSEYQYYEFRAIDQSLNVQQMDQLRDISTRAEITPTSFVNEYQWGDLKADPLDFMKKYFDAHLYFANWGTRILMLRIPRDLIDVDAARWYCNDETLSAHVHRKHVIVRFVSQDEGGDFYDWEYEDTWLSSLIPLRDELMRGDFRCLYLGWLAGVWEDDDNVEPPIPPGLSKRSGSLESLTDYLQIDDHLLDAAIKPDTGSPPIGPTRDEMKNWATKIPVKQMNEWITRLLADEESPTLIASRIRHEFRTDWNKSNQTAPPKPSQKTRTAAELYHIREELAEEARRLEEQRKAKEKEKQNKKAAAERKKYLQQLEAKETQVWQEVETLLATTNQQNYDRAVGWLKDLRDLAMMSSSVDQWTAQITDFRARYYRKSSLMKRFDKADFPSQPENKSQ